MIHKVSGNPPTRTHRLGIHTSLINARDGARVRDQVGGEQQW